MQHTENSEPRDPVVNEPLPATRQHSRGPGFYLTVCIVLLVSMFGFVYANAQYFVMICQRIGLLAPPPASLANGAVTTGGRPLGEELDIYFSATVNDNLPLVFTVGDRYQKVNVNGVGFNQYKVVNTSGETIYYKPVHDVYPTKAGMAETLILTKCFCFDQQEIGPYETALLPVEYSFIDTLNPETRTIRMAYSLHRSDKATFEAFKKAQEAGETTADKAAAAARQQEVAP